MMNSPSLTEKLGQCLIVGFDGLTPEDAGVKKVIGYAEQGLIGGVILFRYNIQDKEQLQKLLLAFKQAKTPYPLFILVDQEGGKVQRIHRENGFSSTPSAREVSNLTAEEANIRYSRMASDLGSAGFNFDFAPCIDLDCEPPCEAIGKLERSYGADPEVVATYASIMIEALREKGILSCVKHFPGHGRARGDTHSGLVDITATWSEEELQPYRLLCSQDKIDAVMTAHVTHQKIESGTPATFSKEWINKLRQEVGFAGVIVTDDLHMGAVINRYSPAEVICNCFKAGINLLVFSNNPLASKAQGIRHDTFKGEDIAAAEWKIPDFDFPRTFPLIVKKLLENRLLSESNIEKSFELIVSLKQRL